MRALLEEPPRAHPGYAIVDVGEDLRYVVFLG